MEKEIRVIDEGGLFDEIRAFLDMKGVNSADYRLIEAESYVLCDSDKYLEEERASFIVPKEFAEQIVKVVYTENYSELQFKGVDEKVLIESQNFHHGDWDKVTAFAFEDLNFHLEDIFE